MIRYFSVIFLIAQSLLFSQNESVSLDLVEKESNDLLLRKIDKGSGYDIVTTGSDPYVFTNRLTDSLDDKNTVVSFEYFCPTGLDFIEVHFFPMDDGLKPLMIRDIGSTEAWVEFKIDIAEATKVWGKTNDYLRLDFGAAPDLKIQVRNIKLRPQTQREIELEARKEEQRLLQAQLETNLKNYLSHDYGNQISSVLVNDAYLEITGIVNDKDLLLAEVAPYEDATELDNYQFVQSLHSEKGQFKTKLERYVDRDGHIYDRLLSKWLLVGNNDEAFVIKSHARYADSIVPKNSYKFVKPATIKGLGGYSSTREAPLSDLDDLGISSVTVNILLTRLLRSSSNAETISFEYLGTPYYVSKKELESLDATLQSTSERSIEVSAILLVDKAVNAADKQIGEILEHPDCDPAGIYSMPNLTNPKGLRYYTAILDFLANRYTRPDKRYGRIHHWIIHNEVDAGWVWTNAGDKTAQVFMDLYHKSMRLSYNIARSYHPESKVFISLTHYWNWTSNPKFYHSKDLLEILLDYSQKEGDFHWAIAQHPYPEDLRNPKTWLDDKVSFDFDTKLITFKNTEVLDAWVKQPEVLYQGKILRSVYLSENGTNSPTYSEQDLKEQAAGMAYALKKIKYLDAIDGFQYHNWQDNRKEGGLRIGLRRFPDDEEMPGGIKPVWEVYSAFGTEKEDEVFDQYKEVIGIKNWDEIRKEVEPSKDKK